MAYYADMGKILTLYELSAIAYFMQPKKNRKEYETVIIKSNIQHIKELKKNEKLYKIFITKFKMEHETIASIPAKFITKKMYYMVLRKIYKAQFNGTYIRKCHHMGERWAANYGDMLMLIPENIRTKKFYEYWCEYDGNAFCYMLNIMKNHYTYYKEPFYIMEDENIQLTEITHQEICTLEKYISVLNILYRGNTVSCDVLRAAQKCLTSVECNTNIVKRYLTLEEIIAFGFSSIKEPFHIIDCIYDLLTKNLLTLILSFDGAQLSKLWKSKYKFSFSYFDKANYTHSNLLDYDVCLTAVKQNPLVVNMVPTKYLSVEICELVVKSNPRLLFKIPPIMHTISLYKIIISHKDFIYDTIHYFLEDLLTEEICELIVSALKGKKGSDYDLYCFEKIEERLESYNAAHRVAIGNA